MQFDLVSPERSLASLEAASVELPGSEGDMTVMPDHAALMTSLCPGVLKVDDSNSTREFVITGGIAEITPGSVTILAEQAYSRDEMTPDLLAELVAGAEQQANEAEGQQKDVLARYHACMVTTGQELKL